MNVAERLAKYASEAATAIDKGDSSRARLLASAIGVEAEATIRQLLHQDRPAAEACPVCHKNC